VTTFCTPRKSTAHSAIQAATSRRHYLAIIQIIFAQASKLQPHNRKRYLISLSEVPNADLLKCSSDSQVTTAVVCDITLRTSNHSKRFLRLISQVTLHYDF
jgi:hypothetical protein